MGTHWERKKINIPTLLQKKKPWTLLGHHFGVGDVFPFGKFFSQNLLNIPFVQKNRLKAIKKLFKITMFSHIVQQIAMI